MYQYQPYQLYNTASRTNKSLCDNTYGNATNSNTRRGSLCNYYNSNSNTIYNSDMHCYEAVPATLINTSRLRSNEYNNLSNTNLSIHENCYGDI